MKDILLLFLFSCTLLTCSKTDEICPTATSKIIESLSYDAYYGQWETQFHYDDAGKLISVEKEEKEGIEYSRYDFEYENERLANVLYYYGDEKLLYYRDSFVYDTSGKIEKQFIFNRDWSTGGTKLWQRVEYEYNAKGQLAETVQFIAPHDHKLTVIKFFWENNNLARKEVYSSNELSQEYLYIYDDQPNIKKDSPLYIRDVTNWSANNMISETETITHRGPDGEIIPKCEPCTTEYTYHCDGSPKTLKNDEYVLTFNYQ